MANKSRMLWALLALSVLSVGGWYWAATRDVTWATQTDQWDGWKPDVVRMRAAREQQPLPGYLYSEAVTWDGHYDVDGDKLADGRLMNLEMTASEQDDLFKWEKGRKLYLCYDENRGATLLDPSTSRSFRVKHVTDNHPIDGYIRSLGAESTYDMMSAGYEEERLWCLEVDRCVRDVLALRHLPDDVRADFIKLTKVRVDYCRMQSQFAASSIHASYAGGTIAGPATFGASCRLYRQAYFDLSGLSEAYGCFNNSPAPEPDR